jgi:signal peptidase I
VRRTLPGAVLCAVLLLALAASVHLWLVTEYLALWVPAGIFAAVVGVAQAGCAYAVLRRPSAPVAAAAIAGNLGLVGLWMVSRSFGLPFGATPPERLYGHANAFDPQVSLTSGVPQAAGAVDLAAVTLELGAVAALVSLLPRVPHRWIVNALFAAGLVLLAGRGLEPVRIASDSMAPTLAPGSHVILDRLSYHVRDPQRGDIVAFEAPDTGELTIKRVVGVAGDRVGLEDGVLVVNGAAPDEPYVNLAEVDSEYYGPVTVPEGTVIVMGDHRGESIDSRSYGPVEVGSLSGRVLFDF